MKGMALIFLSALAFSNSAGVNDAPEFSGKLKKSIISGLKSGEGNSGINNVFLGDSAGKNSTGHNRINIGYLSGEDSEGDHNVGIGFSSFIYSKGNNNVSIGLNSGSNVEGINNTSIGGTANGFYNKAGRIEKKKFSYSTAVGWYSSNHEDFSTALGSFSNAKGAGSVSAGALSIAEEKLSSTLGYGSKASVVSSVSLGALSEATTESGVVGKMFEGKFENDDDKLYEFVASQSNQKDLNTKEAYEKLLNSIEKKNEERKKLKKKEELEKWDADNKAKLDEDIKKRDELRSKLIVWKSNLGAVSIGADGKYTRQLTNLAAGTKATDAVNLAQLESVMSLPVRFYKDNEVKAETKLSDMNFELSEGLKAEKKEDGRVLIGLDSKGLENNEAVVKIRESVNSLSHDVKNSGAMSAALSGLGTVAAQTGRADQLLFSLGTYKGAQAIAFGFTKYVNDNIMVSLGMSKGFSKGSGFMGNLGFSWRIADKKVDELSKLKNEVDVLKRELEEMKNLIKSIDKN